MDKPVYLFELDSIRKKKNQIISGQRAVISEIVKNGNCVALTMNQLTDSLAFAELIRDEKTYPHILSLFRCGALRVSLYGNIRTASQYMQQSLDKCLDPDKDSFIFSSLPIATEDTERIALVKDALQYSDLSKISERIDDLRARGDASLEGEIADMEYIWRYVNLVLTLSVTDTSNLPPKRSDITLTEIMERIISLLRADSVPHPTWQNGYAGALDMLARAKEQMIACGIDSKQINNRSNWLDAIDSEGEETPERRVAELIVHLSYNYKVEDSISGAVRHYGEGDESFVRELVSRIEFILDEEGLDAPSAPSHRAWACAARIAEYHRKRSAGKPKKRKSESGERTYEYHFIRNRIYFAFSVFARLSAYSLIALLYILLFCAIEYVFSFFEGMTSVWFAGLYESELVSKVAVILVFGFLGSVVSAVTKIPDIFQCVKNIALYIHDMAFILGGRYDSYRVRK